MISFAKIAKALLILAAGLIFWHALSPDPPSAAGLFDFDKVNHVAAFFVLGALMDYAFPGIYSIVLKTKISLF